VEALKKFVAVLIGAIVVKRRTEAGFRYQIVKHAELRSMFPYELKAQEKFMDPNSPSDYITKTTKH
jgi:hypothetical protein